MMVRWICTKPSHDVFRSFFYACFELHLRSHMGSERCSLLQVATRLTLVFHNFPSSVLQLILSTL